MVHGRLLRVYFGALISSSNIFVIFVTYKLKEAVLRSVFPVPEQKL
jgi:hypothetical protein